MIMLVLIASMNRVTPVLANETKVTNKYLCYYAMPREAGLEIQSYKWKIT